MRRQNVDVLLKVRSARESTALAELGVQRHEVNGLQMQLEEATSNLAHLVMSGARNVNHAKNLATLRSSSAACLRQITDSLLLAQLRERAQINHLPDGIQSSLTVRRKRIVTRQPELRKKRQRICLVAA